VAIYTPSTYIATEFSIFGRFEPTPRMRGEREPWVDDICRPGVTSARAVMLLAPSAVSDSPETAEIAIGTSCRGSERFWAVTTTSSNTPPSGASDPPNATPADSAAPKPNAATQIAFMNPPHSGVCPD
jgi:hypothetical protein